MIKQTPFFSQNVDINGDNDKKPIFDKKSFHSDLKILIFLKILPLTKLMAKNDFLEKGNIFVTVMNHRTMTTFNIQTLLFSN